MPMLNNTAAYSIVVTLGWLSNPSFGTLTPENSTQLAVSSKKNYYAQTEGYALDWSGTVPGRLVTGDCSKSIHVWNLEEGGACRWLVDKRPFTGHTKSVEDLQWSPNERNVSRVCVRACRFCFSLLMYSLEPHLYTAECHTSRVQVLLTASDKGLQRTACNFGKRTDNLANGTMGKILSLFFYSFYGCPKQLPEHKLRDQIIELG